MAKNADFRQSTAAMFLTLKDEPDDTLATDTSEKNQVNNIDISEIDDFPGHPFHVVVDDAMNEMVESVKQFGVLSPVIVRKKEDDRYELVSGHRRKKACELAGIDKLPTIVREMDRDEAVIFMVDSNLQREKLLPSEKAFSYKMKMDALKRQGTRNDLTSTPVVSKLRSNEIVGSVNGDSREQVRRYIRLTELEPTIMQMVDDGKIAFRPAVELSYLPHERQKELLDVMIKEECTPSLSQAQRMKEAAQVDKLDQNGMELVMREEKPQQNNITIKGSKLEQYFPKEYTPKQKEDMIIKALDFYCKRQERIRQERDYER